MNSNIHHFIEKLKSSSSSEYLSDLENHNRVVSNIIKGCKDWTPTELQHYQNYPKEVERSINYCCTGIHVWEDGLVYQHGRISIYLSNRDYVQNNINKRHIDSCSYSAAAICGTAALCVSDMGDVCAAVTGTDNNIAVAVVIADNNCVDVAIMEIGSGVFEVKGAYGGDMISIGKACDMAWGICSDDVPRIDHVFLLGNQALDISKQQIVGKKFGKTPHCYAIYLDLLELGCQIYQGVLQGDVKDLLILNAVPMPIGLRMVRDKLTVAMVSVFDECTTIPAKVTVRLRINSRSCHGVEMEIVQGDFSRNEPDRLWKLKTIGRFKINNLKNEPTYNDYKVSVDIDCNNFLSVEVRDSNSDEILPIKQLPCSDEVARIDVPVVFVNSIRCEK